MMIRILFALLIFPVIGFSQVYVTQDNPNQFRDFQGSIQARKNFRLPVIGGHTYAATDSVAFIRYDKTTGQVYYFNGVTMTWVVWGSGGGGTTDSNIFATNYRVDTAKANLRTSIDNKLNITDTGAMLNPLWSAINAKLSGTDPRIDDWDEAYSWGNHASAGYAVSGTGSTQVRNNNELDARYTTDTKVAGRIGDSLANLAIVARTGSYNSLSDKPTALPPSGTAGGGLMGTYPDPGIAAGSVGTTQIADGAVTPAKLQKVATNTIRGRVTADSGSVEDLSASQVRDFINVENGATANQSDAHLLSRANHTGTQSISTISGLQASLDSNDKMLIPIKTISSGYTLSSDDLGSLINVTGGSPPSISVVTPNSLTGFPAGWKCVLLTNGNTGVLVSVGVGTGQTLLSADSKTTTRTKGSMATLVYLGSNIWVLSGDIN
jgi:hypothetical protein